MKVLLLYPLLAGAAVLAVGAAARGVGRGATAMAVALLPLPILLVDPLVRGTARMVPAAFLGIGFSYALAFLGWTGLAGGGLALWVQRANRAAAVTAAGGGAAYLLYLVIPVHAPGFHLMPPIAQPFLMLTRLSSRGVPLPMTLVFAVVMGIAQVVVMIAASLLAIRCALAKALARRWTRGVLTLVLAAVGAVILSALVTAFSVADVVRPGTGVDVAAVLSVQLKMFLCIGALLACLPLGLADLILELRAARPGPAGFTLEQEPPETSEPPPDPHGAAVRALEDLGS
jgi:hypothetical protein